MSWSDKAVSPVVYTPGAGEMTLDSGLSVTGGKVVDVANSIGIKDDFDGDLSKWLYANASTSGGNLVFSGGGGGWMIRYIKSKTSVNQAGKVFQFSTKRAAAVDQSFMFAIGVSGFEGFHLYCQQTDSFTIGSQKYGGTISFANVINLVAIGQFIHFRINIQEGNLVTVSYSIDQATWIVIHSATCNSTTGYMWLTNVLSTSTNVFGYAYVIGPGLPLVATILPANAFIPTSPAKLTSLPSAVLTLDTAGAAGTVGLYLQHYNDVVQRWESYDGIADGWTLIGSASSTTTFTCPTLPAREGEKVRAKLVFQSTDGTAPAPAFVSLALSWTSDVTAPDAPTISKILSAATADSVPGYRADFGALPAGSRYLILEGQLNSGGWLPFSQRAKFENSQGYMKFRGDISAVEAAGERNEQHISAAKGLALGDVVEVRIAAEDDVGNRSAFTASDALTIAPAVAAVTPSLSIEDAVLSTGHTGTIRVHLHGPTTENVSVDYASADDTATDPADYSGMSGTLTFTADPADPHQFQDIAINATGDDPTPGTTQYTITLSNPVGATIDKAEGVVTINALDYVPVMVNKATVRVNRSGKIRVEVRR